MTTRPFRLAAAGFLIAVATTPLLAQEQTPKVFTGRVEIGVRQLVGDGKAAKFREYRDIPSGFFVRNLNVRSDDLIGRNYFLNFQTRESIEKDQSYLLNVGKYGKFRLQLRWDQTPHLFTTSAKTLFMQASPGVLTIPAATRAALQTKPEDAAAIFGSSPTVEVGLRRNTGSAALTVNPTAELTIGAQYSREKQSGARPFGTTMYFTYITEVPEPIEYRTNLGKISAEYAKAGKWGVQVAYATSFFENKISSLVWDNPFRVTGDAVDNPTRGRLDLYPDNRAHNLSFAGAMNLGKAARLAVSIVPGWMLQNSSLLPFTTNPAIVGLPALPASNFNGRKQTLAMNFTLATRPVHGVGLNARYRSYDLNNDSSSMIFPTYVAGDMHIAASNYPGGTFLMARRNLPFGFNRKTAGVDASWIFHTNNSIKFLYEFERMDREHRDVHKTSDHTFGPAVDLNPTDWLLFRASYRRSQRSIGEYEANEESFPNGEGPVYLGRLLALGMLAETRKYDEAARNRDRADLLLQVSPTDKLTFSAVYGNTQDHYAIRDQHAEQLYGLSRDFNQNYGFDASYSPRQEVIVFAEYSREKFYWAQRSRQRTPPNATNPANDSTNNDWMSWQRDWVDTWGTGLNLSLAKNRVFIDTYYSLSASKGNSTSQALGRPTAPGTPSYLAFLVTTGCTVKPDGSCGPVDYPVTSNRYHQLATSFVFRLPHGLSPRFEHRFERYDRNDYQLQVLNPYMFSVDASTRTSVFLGADVPRFSTHVLSFSLEYRF